MNPLNRLISCLLGSIVLAAAAFGCSKPAPPPGAPKEPPAPVSIDLGNETAPKEAPTATNESSPATTPPADDQGEQK